jgi:tetratricopeptide (TPR) repeat protein
MGRGKILAAIAAIAMIGGCSNLSQQAAIEQDTFELTYDRGKAHFEAGNTGLALSIFHKAFEQQPRSVKVLNALGAGYDRMKRFDLSEVYYQLALAVEPESVTTLNNLGYSNFLRGDNERAMDYYAQARSLADQSQDQETAGELATVIDQNVQLAAGDFSATQEQDDVAELRDSVLAKLDLAPQETQVAEVETAPLEAGTRVERLADGVLFLVTRPEDADELPPDLEAGNLDLVMVSASMDGGRVARMPTDRRESAEGEVAPLPMSGDADLSRRPDGIATRELWQPDVRYLASYNESVSLGSSPPVVERRGAHLAQATPEGDLVKPQSRAVLGAEETARSDAPELVSLLRLPEQATLDTAAVETSAERPSFEFLRSEEVAMAAPESASPAVTDDDPALSDALEQPAFDFLRSDDIAEADRSEDLEAAADGDQVADEAPAEEPTFEFLRSDDLAEVDSPAGTQSDGDADLIAGMTPVSEPLL